MDEHLSWEDLRALAVAAGGSGTDHLLFHLLDCPGCRQRVVGSPGPGVTARVLPFTPSPAETGLDACFDRWLQRLRGSGELDPCEVAARLGELLSQPEGRWWLLARNSERYWSYSLAARILHESREASFDDPRRGESLARLALEIVGRLDPRRYGERLILDIEGRARALLGNALRLAADLDGAERSFGQARQRLAGTLDPLEWATYLQLLSSLRRDQRRFDECLELLEEAEELYGQVGETGQIARCLIKKGLLLFDQGEARRAVEPLERALAQVDAQADPRAALSVHQNLILCFAEMGRFVEAQRHFRAAAPLRDRFPDRWSVLRSKWLEGILATGIGRPERAEELFLEVREAYLEEELDYDAALVSLELAVLYTEQRRFDELETLAWEMAAVFVSHQIHREALVALAFFQQAVAGRRATVEVVRRVAVFLRHSRFNPALRFELEGWGI